MLSEEVKELRSIINDKLSAPAGYEPEITMSPQQAAEYLGCTVSNVHQKKNSGSLPYHQIGKTVFFKKSEIDEATKVKPHKKQFFK